MEKFCYNATRSIVEYGTYQNTYIKILSSKILVAKQKVFYNNTNGRDAAISEIFVTGRALLNAHILGRCFAGNVHICCGGQILAEQICRFGHFAIAEALLWHTHCLHCPVNSLPHIHSLLVERFVEFAIANGQRLVFEFNVG